MTHAHDVNVLGALAVEVADRVAQAGNPYGASVSGALAALHGLAGGESIDVLARVVGLSHSARCGSSTGSLRRGSRSAGSAPTDARCRCG